MAASAEAVLQDVGGLALRALLGAGHRSSAEPDEHGDEHAEEEHSSGDETRALRIAAIFIIFAAGVVGALPCLFFPVFRSRSHWLPRVLRAFSAGIIISLALVHIFPEAVEELAELMPLMSPEHPYNVAGPCAIFGAFIMVAMESAANYFVEQRQAKAMAEQMQQQQQDSNVKAVAEGSEPAAAALAPVTGHASQLVLDPHTHACIGQARMSLEATPMPRARDQILAVLFELGCIFHSFIIGLTLGVNTDNFASVRGLVIALSFHQWLEGIALASFIMRAHISVWKGVVMIVTYSLTCPVGIAIGIGISDSYNPESTRAIATQGVFNGLSAGMLLYIALVQLIAEDFTRRELPPASAQLPDTTSSSSPHGHEQGQALPSPHKEAAGKQAGQVAVTLPTAVGACGGHGAGGHGYAGGQGGWVLTASHFALFLGAALMAMLGIWA